ncbi:MULTISPECIES: hypothetical protein [Pseudomonas]|uniref:hypothetical protein n=1 Tax=Pseudomonas TaxID=286 RepID=UPI00158602B3|nr:MULTISPECIES: hypothetical protein [Pseudomonas]MCI0995522.1 hypothetical protein [Pseudomonas corrugata]MDU9031249.1 hypothetical protein [Pseudomonas mediterranea]NUT68957.1 hypothetical protein [Pseudomonas corrugata]
MQVDVHPASDSLTALIEQSQAGIDGLYVGSLDPIDSGVSFVFDMVIEGHHLSVDSI